MAQGFPEESVFRMAEGVEDVNHGCGYQNDWRGWRTLPQNDPPRIAFSHSEQQSKTEAEAMMSLITPAWKLDAIRLKKYHYPEYSEKIAEMKGESNLGLLWTQSRGHGEVRKSRSSEQRRCPAFIHNMATEVSASR